jgi:hypothetical protein
MFTYIYSGQTHSDISDGYFKSLKIDAETKESILNQYQYELNKQAESVRAERNKRLAATDFYMLQDAPAAPVGIAEYRQALRDITEQEGFPWNVEWPELVLSDVPSKVTRRQAIAALTLGGYLSQIETALNAIEDATQKTVAEIFWKESLHFERNNPLLNQLASAIGMTQSDLDELFRQAVSL